MVPPTTRPRGSPSSNEAIIKTEKQPEFDASPRTPTKGRARLQDKSTPKAPVTLANGKSRASKRLMMEEDSPDTSADITTEELTVAEKIIQESKIETALEASPIQETPKKRGRGRPRREDTVKIISAASLTPRRSGRAEAARKKAEAEAERLKLEEELDRQLESEENWLNQTNLDAASSPHAESSSSDEEFGSPKRRKTLPLKTTPKPKRTPKPKPDPLSPTASPTKEPEVKKKKGRPSKQDNVTKQVMSIFQMDDLDLASSQPKPSANLKHTSEEKLLQIISLNFDNNGDSTYSRVPTISGYRKPTQAPAKTEPEVPKKYEALPIPAVDEQGNVLDEAYISKYLSKVTVRFDPSSRLTDERAFFLEGSEGYFEQHNLRFRPSASSLASKAPAIEYEEFIPMVQLSLLIHRENREALLRFHKTLYHQWCFELSQGYTLNFYGIGSKTALMMDFLENYLLDWYEDVVLSGDEMPGVMVLNGYNPSTKIKNVVHDIVSLVVTEENKRTQNLKMPKHVSEAFPFLMSHLKKEQRVGRNGLPIISLILVVHRIDGDAFRDERSQNFLSQLASLPNVWMIASTDNINLSLLWDLHKIKNFNFLWHDATTYEPYSVEISFKDVLSMGRSKKFVGSKGAKYVLSSLTSNARQLYKVLLEMQVAKLEEVTTTGSAPSGLRANAKLGVELRRIYERCVDEYIASNETNFKTMLSEYLEHKMCTLTKNTQGTEIVCIPFSYDEMAKLLEEEF